MIEKLLYTGVFVLIFLSTAYSQVTPISPMNLPEVYDNSIPLPQAAEEGYNMFTDNTFTSLKSQFADKIKMIKDYEVKVNDYIVETAKEVQSMAAGNDAILKDTSM